MQRDFQPLDMAQDVVVQQVAGAGGGGGGSQGVAAESAAVVAVGQRHGVFLGQESADGDAVAQPFGQDHHIRLHAEFLVAEQAAEAPHPGLHFVQDEQDVVAVAPFAQPLEIVGVGDVDAALALHRLHHHGDGVVGGGVHHGLDVVEIDVGKALGDGLKELVVVGLAGGGDGVHGAPVEGVEGGDDLVGAVLVQLAVAAGDFERAFHGLGAAVAEKHPVHTGVFNQQRGDVQLGQRVELVGGLDEGSGLLRDGVHHDGGAVAQVVHGPAGHKVDVLFAVGVPDAGAIAADDDHGAAADGLGVVFLLNGDVIGVAGHKSFCSLGGAVLPKIRAVAVGLPIAAGVATGIAAAQPGYGVGVLYAIWQPLAD